MKFRKTLLLIPTLLPLTSMGSEIDEYGLKIESSHTISMFGNETAEDIKGGRDNLQSILVSNYQSNATDSRLYVNSKEKTRVCTWWDGEVPLSNPNPISTIQNKPLDEIQRGKYCRHWAEYPKYNYGTADVYLGNDNKLDKPVVVVQPYHVDISNSSYSEQQFYNDINSNGLASSLRNAGYDIVLYRYNNQDSGIEFNANGVERLLEILNSKSSVNSTSFIGLSLGGVITRVALRNIEKKSSLNNVATFISFDAPHLGANFPRSILDNLSRLLSKVDSSWCGLSGKCRDARRKLQAIKNKLNTKTFKEIIINSPDGSRERSSLLSLLSRLGHVQTVPTLAITNGSKNTTQGFSSKKLVTHFKLHRKWYNGGSKYFKVYTNPSLDNQAGGYVDFYRIFSDLIDNQAHPITPYVTLGQQHSFVSTNSALAGSENFWDEVVTYPTRNERHMTLNYTKARKIRQWLEKYHN